jgi:protoheme IX farnesyltransferase
VYERDTDSLMWRTRSRPLAAQRVTPAEATVFSSVIAALGLVIVVVSSNLLAAFLTLLTLVSYNVIYTPMKRRSELATLVGAVPGALPPMIGWVAARGVLTAEAWALFGIVFVWQIPHFMAIAWLYREDFGRAGFPMLPVVEPDGRSTGRQAVIFSTLLVPVSLAPYALHVSGSGYALAALVGGASLLALAVGFAVDRTNDRARLLFLASITYLPLLWIALIVDRL